MLLKWEVEQPQTDDVFLSGEDVTARIEDS